MSSVEKKNTYDSNCRSQCVIFNAIWSNFHFFKNYTKCKVHKDNGYTRLYFAKLDKLASKIEIRSIPTIWLSLSLPIHV